MPEDGAQELEASLKGGVEIGFLFSVAQIG